MYASLYNQSSVLHPMKKTNKNNKTTKNKNKANQTIKQTL